MIQSATAITVQSSLGYERLSDDGALARGRGADARAGAASEKLTVEQQRQVDELKQIDRKVRAHEQAHLAVGADLVRGGASFTYQTGPDKNRYAVAGEVSIDASPGRTPEETIPKAQHIRATALAPVDPSPQDYSVAAQASQMENDARIDVAAQQSESKADSAKSSAASLYSEVEQNGRQGGLVGGSLDSFA